MTHHAARSKYVLPGLDGLRALAVALVLIFHLVPSWMPTGLVGVDVFFVISGFLITGLLLKEERRNGRLNLPAFWVRRARRLIPAVLVLVLVTVPLAGLLGGPVLAGLARQVFGAVTFTSNWTSIAAGNEYFRESAPELFTNLWSLGIEEQFYVGWPIVLAVVVVTVATTGRRALTVLGIAVGSAAIMAVLLAVTADVSRVYYGTDTHSFGLFLGAALALARPRAMDAPSGDEPPHTPGGTVWLTRLAHPVIVVVAFTALVGIAASPAAEMPRLLYPGGLFLASLCTVVLINAILEAVREPGPSMYLKILEFAPLTWVGRRSYGLYLWHWPLAVLAQYAAPEMAGGLRVAVILALTVMCTELSFRWIENPVRRYGFRECARRVTARTLRGKPVTAVLSALLVGGLATALTVTLLNSPTHSSARSAVESGEQALRDARQHRPDPSNTPAATPPSTGELPTAEPSATPTPADSSPVQPQGKDITVIGDSVALASARGLLDAFPGADVDAQVSRSAPQALDTVRSRAQTGALRPNIVFAAATNSTISDSQLDDLAHMLGHRQIYVVTGHGTPAQPWIEDANSALKRAAERHRNVHLVDWDAAISAHPEWLADDGVHPDGRGGELYADTIREAMTL